MSELKMPNINYTVVAGRISNEPQLKYTTSGFPVLTFSIAYNYSYKKGDKWEQEVNYFNVTVVGKYAETIVERLDKGIALVIEGRLRQRSWIDKETNLKVYATDIIANKVSVIEKRGEPIPKQETGREKSMEFDAEFGF
jgi:single-strand DNA-binding protein